MILCDDSGPFVFPHLVNGEHAGVPEGRGKPRGCEGPLLDEVLAAGMLVLDIQREGSPSQSTLVEASQRTGTKRVSAKFGENAVPTDPMM